MPDRNEKARRRCDMMGTGTMSGPTRPTNPIVDAFKRDVDRTLIRENLKLSVEDRFRQLMRLQEFAEELQRAGHKPQSRS